MSNLSFRGVTRLTLADDVTTVDVLMFSMESSVTTDFALSTTDGSGKTIVLTSTELTVSGNVLFFASRFSGKLAGIPVTFTPQVPPPPFPPLPEPLELTFTDPDIQLVLVTCDSLDAKKLRIDTA